jgi:hypothetical protein
LFYKSLCSVPFPSRFDSLREAMSMALATGLSHSALKSPAEPNEVMAAVIVPL